MRRVTIPLIIDVLMVDDPAQIAALDAEPAVTRNFAKSESWAVRWLGMRLRKALSIGNTLFPALLPREDLIRQGQTEALQRRFGPKGENAAIRRDDVLALARYVRGEVDEAAMIMRLQSVVGRQFSLDYKATRQTVRRRGAYRRRGAAFRQGFLAAAHRADRPGAAAHGPGLRRRYLCGARHGRRAAFPRRADARSAAAFWHLQWHGRLRAGGRCRRHRTAAAYPAHRVQAARSAVSVAAARPEIAADFHAALLGRAGRRLCDRTMEPMPRARLRLQAA